MNHLFRSLNLLMETPQYNELPLITLMAFTILKILIYFIPLSNYSLRGFGVLGFWGFVCSNFPLFPKRM